MSGRVVQPMDGFEWGVDEFLRRVGRGLDQGGVSWVVLREGALARGQGSEVDILVAPHSIAGFETIVKGLGFVVLHSSGRGTHRFHLGYDESSGQWLQLDVVSELAYGPGYIVRLDDREAVDGCLRRRRRVNGVWRLDHADLFWTLVLHCVLDKRAISPRRRVLLTELAHGLDLTTAPLVGAVRSALPRACPVEEIVRLVRDEAWARVLAARGPLLRHSVGYAPKVAAGRIVCAGIGRLMEKPRQFRQRRGLTVALLGPDGVGKTTTAMAAVRAFAFPARRVYMGMWQGAEKGPRTPVRAVGGIVLRPFRVWWRVATAAVHTTRGRLVVFDRYTYDALLPPTGSLQWLKRMYFSILAHLAPRPDLILVLDAPGQVAFDRKGESEPHALESARRRFREIGQRFHADVVDTTRGPDAVRADVTARIWRRYAERCT
jgi:thymidylate kinase